MYCVEERDKKLLIVKTGHTVNRLLERGEDFEGWIISAMRVDEDTVLTVSVYQDQSLPDLSTVSGIVVTGSPAMITDGEDWNFTTMDYLTEAVEQGIPILGICYGHQLLAQAFGGKVDFHSAGREIGTVTIELAEEATQDPLFTGLPRSFFAQSSHSQSVIKLPVDAVLLASNDFEPHHSFRLGKNAWGIQFHPEFSDFTMNEYIKERRGVLLGEGANVDELLAGTKATSEATKVLMNFGCIISQAR